jgi:glycerol-3-phosphate acyltransferase PlsY
MVGLAVLISWVAMYKLFKISSLSALVAATLAPVYVYAAAFLPPIRITLVAPGFLEPSARGSAKPITRQTIIALEMEPNKYATGTKSHSIIFLSYF